MRAPAERRNAGLRLLSGICSAQTCSAGPAAGPDADRLGAAAQLRIAFVLQPFEERRLCRWAGGDRLGERVANDERRIEAARQPLQAAGGVDRVADDGEGQA